MGESHFMPAPPLNPDAREAALRELIATFEQRSSGATIDLFETAKKDLSGTKKLIYGSGTAFAALFSTIVGWSMDFVEQSHKQAETIQAQAKNIEDLQTQVRLMSARQETLARRLVSNEVLIVDGVQWVADKIDLGRRSSKKEAPRSIAAAQRRIDDAGSGSGQLFQLDGLPGR
jgi:hypothetical protein